MNTQETTDLDMESSCKGQMTIPVFEFLKGRPWGDEAKSFVSSLRPSRVRIVRDGKQCDSVAWRVTVWLNHDDTINLIEQEVVCNLYGETDEHGFTKQCGGDVVRWAMDWNDCDLRKNWGMDSR